jgi:hypothetical protein
MSDQNIKLFELLKEEKSNFWLFAGSEDAKFR